LFFFHFSSVPSFSDIPVGTLSKNPGQLHYWFIESTNDPQNDPIVLWLNGGPGSSSLIGLLTEMGQVSANDNSLAEPIDGVPQLFLNPYTWNSVSNMIYLESPKGVGFSYCENAQSEEECVNTDESTALDAYEFLVNWFNAYPEYQKHRFYITGESYAGNYIPMLMEQVDLDPLGAKNMNLIGAAIGNGCWGNTVGTCWFVGPESHSYEVEFLFGHGMFSQELKSRIDTHCNNWERNSAECFAVLGEMKQQTGDFYIYNIYDECGEDQRRRRLETTDSTQAAKSWLAAKELMSQPSVKVTTKQSFRVSAGYSEALNDYTCGAEAAMDAYLAHPDVVEALHVKAGTPGMTYKKTVRDLPPLYKQLIDKYQMLIYSGDTDACVPYVGTEKWTRDLNYTMVNDWHQWFSQSSPERGLHKAGYAVNYDKFQFVTITGAGHMVPQFQGSYALTMYKKFLNNEVF
jgi:carboxypeptidase C (cathepsin A)